MAYCRSGEMIEKFSRKEVEVVNRYTVPVDTIDPNMVYGILKTKYATGNGKISDAFNLYAYSKNLVESSTAITGGKKYHSEIRNGDSSTTEEEYGYNRPSKGANPNSTSICYDLHAAGFNWDTWSFESNIPIFDNMDYLNKYFKTGNTDNALHDTAVIWDLYVDGTNKPYYKLKWKFRDGHKYNDGAVVEFIKAEMIAELGVSTVTGFIDHDNATVRADSPGIKFNWDEVNDSWAKEFFNDGTNAIIVRIRDYEGLQVIPTGGECSSYMYCTLPKDGSKGDVGYCEKCDNSDNPKYDFMVSDNGDGSQFNIHIGDKGAEEVNKDVDKDYDHPLDDDDDDNDSSKADGGVGVFTSTFKMSKDRLTALGNFLWNSDPGTYSLINSNPIENIISCKSIPLDKSGSTKEIVLGNVKTGINGELVSDNFDKIVIGSVTISEYYKSFFDYAPYTNVIIYLPYIGFKELDTNLVMGKTIKVEYNVDAVTGSCLAQIYSGKIRLYEFSGNMGADIPITASNRAQVEGAYIKNAVSAGLAVIGGSPAVAAMTLLNSATAQYHYSSTGSPNPSAIANINRTCYIVIDRPVTQNLNAFNHTKGRKCNLSKRIGSLNGFTICDPNIDLSGIVATEEEKDELKRILSTGFFA